MKKKLIEITSFGKKQYLEVMDDEPTMREILSRIVEDQRKTMEVDNRKPSSDEIYKTSILRLRKFRRFLNAENLKKTVDNVPI